MASDNEKNYYVSDFPSEHNAQANVRAPAPGIPPHQDEAWAADKTAAPADLQAEVINAYADAPINSQQASVRQSGYFSPSAHAAGDQRRAST